MRKKEETFSSDTTSEIDLATALFKSIDDTECWFEQVLRTKVPSTGKALTEQQLRAVRDFDAMYNAKRKVAECKETTAMERELAAMYGISLQTGKGCGKTTTLAGLALKHMVLFKKSITLILGASYDQTKSTIWAEMSRLLAGSIIANDVHIGAERAYMLWTDKGKEARESAYRFIELRATNVGENQNKQAKKFAGYHADTQLFIFDEATGISRPVFVEVESTLGYAFGASMMLVAFNPDVPVCYAVDTQTIKRDFFICHHWDAEESELVNKEYIEGRKREYGESSNEYMQWVKGIAPPASNDSLIPWPWIQQAVNRKLSVDDKFPIAFSYDSKGTGKCEAVFSVFQGGILREQRYNNIPDTYEQADWLCAQTLDYLEGRSMDTLFKIMVEINGLGWGVYCDLKRHPSGLIKYTKPVDVSVPAANTSFTKYAVVRDQLWGNIRRMFQDGVIQIPDDRKLIKQLGLLTFTTENGKFKVRSKSDIGKEPMDRADSLMLAAAYDVKKVHGSVVKKISSRYYGKEPAVIGDNDVRWLTV